MKKFRIISFILVLSALFSMVSCSSLDLVKLTKNDEGLLVNKSAKLSYTYAPTYIEPTSVGEAYAIYKNKNSEMTLYAIPGLEPEKWLCEEYSGMSTVFLSTDIEIPTLESFAPDIMYICVSEEITISIATVEDAEVIVAVVDTFMNGADADYPLIDSKAYYQLKFASPEYEGLYYNITYAIFDEGAFFYDRSTKRCVSADGLLDEFVADDIYGATGN